MVRVVQSDDLATEVLGQPLAPLHGHHPVVGPPDTVGPRVDDVVVDLRRVVGVGGDGGARERPSTATNTNHTTEIDYDVIDSRTFCLWGVDDRMVPVEWGERLAEDLDGEVVPLEDAYHWVVEDRPDGYREALAGALA